MLHARRPSISDINMQRSRRINLRELLRILAGILILKVTLSVVLGYRDYFSPNFGSDFLQGRQDYFFGPYQWAFYTHIGAGPLTLLIGLLLISEKYRSRFPKWHRRLGKLQVVLVLCLLSPSGLWMAQYAQSGVVAALGFSGLAIATAACVLLGWRCAVKRQFAEHQQWMWRCFLLLCSAVIVRLVGGLAIVLSSREGWIYPVAAWGSWLAPLAAYELSRVPRQPFRRVGNLSKPHFVASAAASP
jgi:Predicted membrane protein (DUF2306)